MRRAPKKTILGTLVWAIVVGLWNWIGNIGNLQTVWDAVNDWPTIFKWIAVALGTPWLPIAIAISCLLVWWYLNWRDKEGLWVSLQPKWGAPQFATIINNDRDYPAHIKRSTLYGIRRDRTRERLYDASKFQQCPPAPLTVEPERQMQQAFGGYIPFNAFSRLQVEIELENGKIIVSRKVRPPAAPQDNVKSQSSPASFTGEGSKPEAEPPPPRPPPFDANNAFAIGALTTSNLKNLTEVGQDMEGKAAWSLDCEITIHNLHLTRPIDDVTFRILDITPPIKASPLHHPRTQDTTLRRVTFPFTDIAPGRALLGDQTGHVRIFNAVKHVLFSQGITTARVKFYGAWPDGLATEFAPEVEHLLTVEVAGNAVKRQEAQFRLLFSTDTAEPVVSIVPAVRRQSHLLGAKPRFRPKLILAEQCVLVKDGKVGFSFLIKNAGATAAKTANFVFAVQNARLAIPPLVQNELTSQAIVEGTNRRVTYSFPSIDPESAYIAFHISYTGEDGRKWDDDPVFLCWPGIQGDTIHTELNYLLDKETIRFTEYLRKHEIPTPLLQALNRATSQH